VVQDPINLIDPRGLNHDDWDWWEIGAAGAVCYLSPALCASTAFSACSKEDIEEALFGRDDPRGPADPAAGEFPVVRIDDAQFGKKWGKHARDYGRDPGNAQDRSWYRNRITEVSTFPEQVRTGPFSAYEDAYFFKSGNDIVIAQQDGTFVSMFPLRQQPADWWTHAEVVYP